MSQSRSDDVPARVHGDSDAPANELESTDSCLSTLALVEYRARNMDAKRTTFVYTTFWEKV